MNTHKTIEEQVQEFKNKFNGIEEDGAVRCSVEEIMWLRNVLTEAEARVREEERERIRKAIESKKVEVSKVLPRLDLAYNGVLDIALEALTPKNTGEEIKK